MSITRTVWTGTINSVKYRLTCISSPQDLANDRLVAAELERLTNQDCEGRLPSMVDRVAEGTANFDKAAAGERWSDRGTSIAHDDVRWSLLDDGDREFR